MKRINIEDCEIGDIICEDIYKEGINIPIIVEGNKFDEKIERKLENMGITDLLIEKKESISNEEPKEVKKFRVEGKVEHKDVNTFKFTSFEEKYIEQLEYISDILVIENFMYEPTILKDIYNFYISNFQNMSSIFKYINRVNYKQDFVKHSLDSAIYALYIGEINSLSNNELYNLFIGALFHDFGKLISAQENKPYYFKGGTYLKEKINIDSNKFLECILYHCEEYGGEGNPKGLKGEDIPLLARITSIADNYERLVSQDSDSKNSPLMSLEKLISLGYSKVLDTELTISFVKKVFNFYKSSKVLFDNGKTGYIEYIPKLNISCPLVYCDGNLIDTSINSDYKYFNLVK